MLILNVFLNWSWQIKLGVLNRTLKADSVITSPSCKATTAMAAITCALIPAEWLTMLFQNKSPTSFPAPVRW